VIEEKIFTTEQVANILQVHPFTILKFIREGKLKGIKLGRVYRIKESDIRKFLEERMTNPKKKADQQPPPKEEKEIPMKKDTKETASYKIDNEKRGEEDEHYYII
jgi:excisionase family DNA binding protein